MVIHRRGLLLALVFASGITLANEALRAARGPCGPCGLLTEVGDLPNICSV